MAAPAPSRFSRPYGLPDSHIWRSPRPIPPPLALPLPAVAGRGAPRRLIFFSPRLRGEAGRGAGRVDARAPRCCECRELCGQERAPRPSRLRERRLSYGWRSRCR
jgi:hypothetical protein